MGRNEVEEFIDNFYTYAAECIDRCAYSHASVKADSMEAIRRFYHSGYCYHFACILKSTFNRGRLVWMAPFSHIAWEDTDGTVYDVEGKYKGEALYAIPEEYVGVHMLGFKHCKFPGNHIDTKEELIKVVKTYCELSGEEYNPEIEDMFRDTGISDVLTIKEIKPVQKEPERNKTQSLVDLERHSGLELGMVVTDNNGNKCIAEETFVDGTVSALQELKGW